MWLHSGHIIQIPSKNTNFIVFGLTRPGLEPTIYHTRGEHTDYYTTDEANVPQLQILSNIVRYHKLSYFGCSLIFFFILWKCQK